MSLRLEGHAALWAIALLSLAAVALRGPSDTSQLAGESSEIYPPVAVAMAAQEAPAKLGERYPRALPELTGSGRDLFPASSSVVVESGSVAAPVETTPVLKGVISDGDAFKAVFGPDPLVIAGLGEVVAGYRIDGVAADHVIAATPTGETVVLKLRGSGELP